MLAGTWGGLSGAAGARGWMRLARARMQAQSGALRADTDAAASAAASVAARALPCTHTGARSHLSGSLGARQCWRCACAQAVSAAAPRVRSIGCAGVLD